MDKNAEVIIRELLRDEYDAISSYEEAILNVHNANAEKVLHDIKEEEIVHVGELKALLQSLGVNDEPLIMKGEEEASGILMESIKKLTDIFSKF